MKHILFIFISLFTFAQVLATAPGSQQEKLPKDLLKTSVQLFTHGQENYLALSFRAHPHWHTYWKNPGDAGLPTQIKIEGIQTQEMSWPVPKRYIEKGNILAYGYEKEFTRFYKITQSLASQNFKINAKWLICKHICIPGQVNYSGQISSQSLAGLDPEVHFLVPKETLKERFNKLPKLMKTPTDVDIVLKKGKEDGKLVLYYNLSNYKHAALSPRLGLLTPYPHELLDIKREVLYLDSKQSPYGKISMEWDGEYAEPSVPFPQDGTFSEPLTMRFLYNTPHGDFSIIEKTFSRFDLTGTQDFEDLLAQMKPAPHNESQKKDTIEQQEIAQASNSSSNSPSLLYYLLFAFFGGLILNVMPCVLPVISIKLFGLIAHSQESQKKIFKHNIFYTLGVLAAFIALAATVVIIKSTGEQVGWGFQLQSPNFIAFTLVVLFVLTLNLFGLFEFATPGGKSLGSFNAQDSFAGDFFSGVIATVLSTPCSAPFLGTALTFAFTSNPLTIFLIFLMIGLGLAFPFLMTGFFPSTIRLLPKPGMWMEHVKKFLGLTLLLTMIWLFDVYISLTSGNIALLKLLTGMVFLFFAFYFKKNISQKKRYQFIFFLIPFLFFASLCQSNQQKMNGQSASDLIVEKNNNSELSWLPWSEETMSKLAQENKVVFMDFTAKWCFTCKVNEKLVINTSAFKALTDKHNMTLLLADWTKYDPKIGAFLKKNGYVGVPAYFIQKPNGDLISLGETISIGEVEEVLSQL